MERVDVSLIDWIASEREQLIASAQRITRRRELAEDATQDAFLRAWRRHDRWIAAREPRAVLRWLTRLHAGMQRRSEARHGGERDLDRLAEARAPDATLDREEADRAWLEVARLPRSIREAIELRFREGLTYLAIAQRCGIAEGTAHERVERGIESLRKRMPTQTDRATRGAWCLLPWRWMRDGSRSSLHTIARIAALGLGTGMVAAGMRPADGDALPVVAELAPPSAPRITTAVEFDLDVFRQRVDLDSYLDAGGSLPPRSIEVPRVIPPVSVRGRALDAGGRALDDARVELRRKIAGRTLEIVVDRVETCFDGSFAFDHIPFEGALRLVILRRTLVALERDLELAPNEAHDLGTLVTDARIEDRRGEFSLELTLRDPLGRPLTDSPVTLSRRLDAFSRASAFEHEDSGRTDSEGRIHLTGDWLGGKRVELGTPGRNESSPAHSIEFTIERGGTQSVELTLR